jgi:hypothetical protein
VVKHRRNGAVSVGVESECKIDEGECGRQRESFTQSRQEEQLVANSIVESEFSPRHGRVAMGHNALQKDLRKDPVVNRSDADRVKCVGLIWDQCQPPGAKCRNRGVLRRSKNKRREHTREDGRQGVDVELVQLDTDSIGPSPERTEGEDCVLNLVCRHLHDGEFRSRARRVCG